MTDDKPTLTRRRVLGGVATIGAAGALGGATMAQMFDTETREYTVEAGTLDLEIAGPDNPVHVGPLTNGEAELTFDAYTNEGNIPGTWFGFEITDVESLENGRSEPEKNAGDNDGEGEFAQYLNVDTDYYFFKAPDGSGAGPIQEDVYNGNLLDLEGTTQYSELPRPMSDDDRLVINVRFVVDDEVINKAMGDSARFNYNFTLYEEEPQNV